MKLIKVFIILTVMLTSLRDFKAAEINHYEVPPEIKKIISRIIKREIASIVIKQIKL